MVAITTPTQLGHHIKAIRKKRKLTQSALGKMIGLSQERVSVIENHPESVRVDQLFTILMALDSQLNVTPRQSQPSSNNIRKDNW